MKGSYKDKRNICKGKKYYRGKKRRIQNENVPDIYEYMYDIYKEERNFFDEEKYCRDEKRRLDYEWELRAYLDERGVDIDEYMRNDLEALCKI